MREKGSKTAMIKLVKSNDFINVLNDLLENNEVKITSDDVSIPNAQIPNKEVTLSTFLRKNFDSEKADLIIRWWIKIGNATPKWDLISTCTISGRKGILLVEAKAHVGELKKEEKGKPFNEKEASIKSQENHCKIAEAIDEVNTSIKKKINGLTLSRDNCYQLSNRIANSWWLANKGIPVVLMYLGFEECTDMYSGTYKLFKTNEEWQTCFKEHAQQIGADVLIDKTVDCGESSFTLICRSL